MIPAPPVGKAIFGFGGDGGGGGVCRVTLKGALFGGSVLDLVASPIVVLCPYGVFGVVDGALCIVGQASAHARMP